MSDLYMHECVDIAWDGFCLRDDHIVPDPGNKKVNGQDSEKKHRCEITSNSSNAGDRSACRCVEQKGCQGGISRLSKRRNTMLEKDSWSYKPDRAATSAFYSDPVKEASNLASDSTSANGLKSNHRNSNSGEFSGLDAILDDKTSIVYNNSFNYPMGGINHASNDINYFENAENKDSSDLIYCDWPEIENFEDIDRMLRNCDSTFGLGICKDESGWLSSNDTGGSGAVLKSDVKFSYLESGDVENISENHDFLNDYSINNMITAPITYKDSSRTSEKSESYRSFVIGPDIVDSKVGFIPQEEQITKSEFNNKIQPSISTDSHSRSGSAAVTIEHHSQIKQKKQSEGKGNEHYPGNYRFSHEFGKLSSGVTSVQPQQQHESSPDSCSYSKNPISYMQSDNSHSAGLSSLNLKLSIVQSETNDLTSVSPEESSHSSSQLQYMGDSPNPDFEATAVPICEQRKMLNCHQVNLSSVHDCQKDGSVTVQASMTDPGLRGKSESHCNAAELSSSNIQENSTMGPDLEDISLEAASFCQLQLVMKQLDLRTRLCIRDSLYRLARSAEQRHNLANMNAGCGEGDDETKRYTSFMDMETHTNPIDRSVAHLLFHRPSDSSTQPAQGSLPFQSSSAVIGSITGPPVLADNLVSEENVSQMEKGKSIRREHQHTRGNPKDKEIPKKHDRRVEREHSISSETDSESEFVFKSRSRSSKSMHSSLSPKSPGKIDLVEPALKKGEIYYRSILRTAINEITALRYDDEQLRELQRTPFWLFFNAIYKSDPKKLKSRVEKHEDTIRKIILCFDESIGRFVIGGKDVSFNKNI